MKVKFLKTGVEIDCTVAEFDIFQQAGAFMEVIQKEEIKKPDVLIKKEPKENS